MPKLNTRVDVFHSNYELDDTTIECAITQYNEMIISIKPSREDYPAYVTVNFNTAKDFADAILDQIKEYKQKNG